MIDGRSAGTFKAEDYLNRRPRIWPSVERSLATLRAEFDVVVAEGVGSPAEPNLRQADVVNMELALHASDTGGVNRSASVLIVGDIDRGGVFAHLVGTMQLLAPNERALKRGFLINRFRGDPSPLDPALIDLEQRTGVPVLGVIPWIDDLGLAEEDGVAPERPLSVPAPAASTDADPDLDLVVCRLPRIANFDDFDPLTREPGVRLRYIDDPAQLGNPAQAARPDCLIIPGTKATIADLQFLQRSGLADAIQPYAADGGTVLGICGGYQMLGRTLIDQSGVEGAIGARADGLYLLPVATQFHETKRTQQVSGRLVAAAGPWSTATNSTVTGYEIHMGRTTAVDGASLDPFLRLDAGPSDCPLPRRRRHLPQRSHRRHLLPRPLPQRCSSRCLPPRPASQAQRDSAPRPRSRPNALGTRSPRSCLRPPRPNRPRQR